MRPFERVLVSLDTWPWSAISRVLIGLCTPLLAHVALGVHNSVWVFPAFFIGILIALRVVPALIRFAVPFSAEAKKIWAQRRAFAKRYDSYQWQKLLWIGLGLLPRVAGAGGAGTGEIIVLVFCLIGGTAGLLIWQTVKD
jgi:hypothetical protein